jgi:hypothetical protein
MPVLITQSTIRKKIAAQVVNTKTNTDVISVTRRDGQVTLDVSLRTC